MRELKIDRYTSDSDEMLMVGYIIFTRKRNYVVSRHPKLHRSKFICIKCMSDEMVHQINVDEVQSVSKGFIHHIIYRTFPAYRNRVEVNVLTKAYNLNPDIYNLNLRKDNEFESWEPNTVNGENKCITISHDVYYEPRID